MLPDRRLAVIQRGEVVILDAAAAVVEILAQGELDAAERDVLPGYFSLGDEFDFQAFRTDPIAGLGETCAKHHVHLVGVQHVHDGEQRADLDVGQSFFLRFAARTLLVRFTGTGTAPARR